MAYGSAEGVEALVPVVMGVDAISTPDEDAVGAWLEEADAIIDTALSGAGYTVPAVDSATIHGTLRALSNLYAAAYVLRARGLDSVTGETETRSEVWLADFQRRLAALVAGDLTGVGLELRPVTSSRQRRVRSVQLRRVDGFSRETIGVTD
jgi:hypothetical protein